MRFLTHAMWLARIHIQRGGNALRLQSAEESVATVHGDVDVLLPVQNQSGRVDVRHVRQRRLRNGRRRHRFRVWVNELNAWDPAMRLSAQGSFAVKRLPVSVSCALLFIQRASEDASGDWLGVRAAVVPLAQSFTLAACAP